MSTLPQGLELTVVMQPSSDIRRLLEIMTTLRAPLTGCAWDVAQTHATLAPYALEEAYEVVDAIERGDPLDLRDELGDLLLQVVFHARVGEEAGAFDFGDVVASVTEKMMRRHPHIFPAGCELASPDGSSPTANRTAVPTRTWEAIKAQERDAKTKAQERDATTSLCPRGLLADVPLALPGLTRAVKLQRRASSVGFDWNDARLVIEKIREEIDEVERELDSGESTAIAGEIGDLLFAVANLARHLGVDPEAAARATNLKFERRFAFIEAALDARGGSPETSSLDEMDALWDEAKRRGL